MVAARGALPSSGGRLRIGLAVCKNRWFQVRSPRRRKPRLKASFQRRSARGISEQGHMVAIRSAWAITLTAGMVRSEGDQ